MSIIAIIKRNSCKWEYKPRLKQLLDWIKYLQDLSRSGFKSVLIIENTIIIECIP